MDRLAKLFVLNRAGLNLERGAVVFGGMLVPFVVLTALDQQQYFLPAAFATLFAAMCDPGGEYRTRVQMMAGMAVAGALLTGLGFAVGARGWGLVVLAAFVVILAAGLMVKFGGHRFSRHRPAQRVVHRRPRAADPVPPQPGHGACLVTGDPTNFATEGKRVLFTFAGVGIAAIVMLLADRLQKHQTPAAPTAH